MSLPFFNGIGELDLRLMEEMNIIDIGRLLRTSKQVSSLCQKDQVWNKLFQRMAKDYPCHVGGVPTHYQGIYRNMTKRSEEVVKALRNHMARSKWDNMGPISWYNRFYSFLNAFNHGYISLMLYFRFLLAEYYPHRIFPHLISSNAPLHSYEYLLRVIADYQAFFDDTDLIGRLLRSKNLLFAGRLMDQYVPMINDVMFILSRCLSGDFDIMVLEWLSRRYKHDFLSDPLVLTIAIDRGAMEIVSYMLKKDVVVSNVDWYHVKDLKMVELVTTFLPSTIDQWLRLYSSDNSEVVKYLISKGTRVSREYLRWVAATESTELLNALLTDKTLTIDDKINALKCINEGYVYKY